MTTWQSVTVGVPCGAGQYCDASAACVQGCFNNGHHVHGTVNPSNACEECTATSDRGWEATPGTSCENGGVCSTDGACLNPLSISAGFGHTCALTPTGVMKCWGENQHGQLGDGTTETRTMPTEVLDLGVDVKAFSAGFGGSTCAVTATGKEMCWGSNHFGQIGDGNYNADSNPAPIPVLASGVSMYEPVTISVGEGHVCAVGSEGNVRCWGHNTFGEVGADVLDAPTDVCGYSGSGGAVAFPCVLAPHLFTPPFGLAGVAVGWEHTCGRTSANSVVCWGRNDGGQLGDSVPNTHLPTTVMIDGTTLDAVGQISAGSNHTCAVTAKSDAVCWGNNGRNQLGDSDTGAHGPRRVEALAGEVIAISAGGARACEGFTCALTRERGVKCWGNNAMGQLGDGTNTDSIVPRQVQGLTAGVVAVSAGGCHTCALATTGSVKCWGENTHGELGDGTTSGQPGPGVSKYRSTPVTVVGFP